MTRSLRADRAGARRLRTIRWFALFALVAAACGGRELSLGGDPVSLTLGASGHAGTFGPGSGGASGGVGGTGGTGGPSSPSGTGGITIGSGGSGGTAAEASTGGAGDDPYPPVTWKNGQGYRGVCPEYDDTSGFTCWHEDSGTGTTCALDGSPVCNACSCAIPCDESSDCPSGQLGEPATCVGSDTNVKSCFLACEEDGCPTGMSCSTYPGKSDRVCVWVDPDAGMLRPVK